MLPLLLVSLLWAFSFGLIKGQLAGVDPLFISFIRLLLALLVFIPFLRRGTGRPLALRLLLAGAVQYGVMYIAYNSAFQFLKSYEVALFTIFTPLYVTLINDAFQRRFQMAPLAAALLAVIGTGVVSYTHATEGQLLQGFLLVQLSNLGFAFGQVYYRQTLRTNPQSADLPVFGWLYLGGAALTALTAGLFTNWQALTVTPSQWLTLLYLGVIASGVGFFLWNYGARRMNAGTLAVFNNLKVPLAVAVSLIFFGESADPLRLALGGGIVLAALFLNERLARSG
jgi:carboxylate/amino acid/amine transporter